MKVPLSWLKEYVDIDIPADELAKKMTFAGLEVEAMEYIGLPQPTGRQEAKIAGLPWDREKFIVADIVGINPHPGADKLVLCDLFDGEETHVVLTGAPNLAHLRNAGTLDEPIKAAWVKLGAQIYDGHKAGWVLTKLKKAKIRGVESTSMVASEKELGISEEHEGIIIFEPGPNGEPVPPAGTPLVDYIGDVVFDIAITPNMIRNASVMGVAREVAAILDKPFKAPTITPVTEGPSIEGRVKIDIREPELNPRFTATLIEGIEIKPSPDWLQRRLRLCGVRAISNMVDVTNYVMLEMGHPLHAFDYDTLKKRAGSDCPTIITRLPDAGEEVTTLDGINRKLNPNTILVADTAGALSLGGIMGGLESEVEDHTTNVLLEVAAWEYINIRKSVQEYALQTSQAGYRYSRGIHPDLAAATNWRGAELMRQLGGGTIAEGMVDNYPLPPEPIVLDYPVSNVKRQLGIEIERPELLRILTALDFEVEDQGETLRITVPNTRLDITTGVVGLADITEEIARIYGYDRIPEVQISDMMPPQRGNAGLELEQRVRNLLVTLGLQEVITYRLTSPEQEAKLGADAAYPYLGLAKPISAEMTVMRQSLLNSVLEIAAKNRMQARQALFEIAPVFLMSNGAEEMPEEQARLVVLLTGKRDANTWNANAPEALDFYDLKGVVDALVDGLHLSPYSVQAAEHPTFAPGKTAALMIGDTNLGTFGELHPQVRSNYSLGDQPVLCADLNLSAIVAAIPSTYKTSAISRFPAIIEDIALIVDEGIPAAQVEFLVKQTGGRNLAKTELFDVYRGDKLGDGKKSLAYRLTYQSMDKTLTDKDAAKIRTKIVKRLGYELGAVLRDS